MDDLYVILKPKANELSLPFLKDERVERKVEDLIGALGIARQFTIDGPTLEVYVRAIGKLDAALYTLGDVELAFEKLNDEQPGEFQTRFPTTGELKARIEGERRLRTQDAAKAASAERMAKLVAFAEAERIKREAEWNERKRVQSQA